MNGSQPQNDNHIGSSSTWHYPHRWLKVAATAELILGGVMIIAVSTFLDGDGGTGAAVIIFFFYVVLAFFAAVLVMIGGGFLLIRKRKGKVLSMIALVFLLINLPSAALVAGVVTSANMLGLEMYLLIRDSISIIYILAVAATIAILCIGWIKEKRITSATC